MNVWCSKSHVWFYCCHIFEQNRFPYFLFLTHYWNLIVPEKQEDTWNEHVRCVSTLSLWGPQCGWGAFHHLWCEATKGWVCKVASLARPEKLREIERSGDFLRVPPLYSCRCWANRPFSTSFCVSIVSNESALFQHVSNVSFGYWGSFPWCSEGPTCCYTGLTARVSQMQQLCSTLPDCRGCKGDNFIVLKMQRL